MNRSKNQGYVYIVHATGTNQIKIGFSTDPSNRLIKLQTGSPYKLALIGLMLGSARTEKALHVLFKQYRQTGEWFALPDCLIRRIEEGGYLGVTAFSNSSVKSYLYRVPRDSERGQFKGLLPALDDGSRWIVEVEGRGWRVRRVWDVGKTTKSIRCFRVRWPVWNLLKQQYSNAQIAWILKEHIDALADAV